MKLLKNIILSIIPFLFLLSACSCSGGKGSGVAEDIQEIDAIESPSLSYHLGICIDSLDVKEHTIRSGESLSVIFSSLGFSPSQIDKICRASAELLDPRRIIAGKKYYTFATQDSTISVQYIAFAHSSTHFTIIDLSAQDSVSAFSYQKEVSIKREYVEGVISSSLWNAIVKQNGDPLLALKLSDIYAWQIDFFDIKEGDAFKVMYEMSYIEDSIPYTIEHILGAVFSHKNVDYYAIPFEQDSITEFFDLEGNSLRRAFLKAPLDYFRITSRYSNSRYHPVLKRYRSHHGVDYAAPVGTPVKTIGDGTVIEKGFQKGGGGNYIKVKHNATYTTVYMHLKGFAKGIQKGSHVQQGEVIGYVGSTGLSTGPHLDFRIYKNGSPIDPLKMDSPPSLPVKEELKSAFDSVKRDVLREMDELGEEKIS